MPEEQTSKLRKYKESTQYQYPRHRSEEQIKPYELTEILYAPMLQPYNQRDIMPWLTTNWQVKRQRYASMNKLNVTQKMNPHQMWD